MWIKRSKVFDSISNYSFEFDTKEGGIKKMIDKTSNNELDFDLIETEEEKLLDKVLKTLDLVVDNQHNILKEIKNTQNLVHRERQVNKDGSPKKQVGKPASKVWFDGKEVTNDELKEHYKYYTLSQLADHVSYINEYGYEMHGNIKSERKSVYGFLKNRLRR